MGFVGFLNFLLLCSDLLVWPVFALGYPMYASIEAIESGSKNRMRKLVIYWTLFSLMSLFELAFFKIIEWISYWSVIKMIVICWLVVPQFDGACIVYDCLVQPCLSLNIEEVMSTLFKTKENKLVTTEVFLDVAEKYIKENGSEALEKLIAAKKQIECMEPDSSPTETQVQISEEQKAEFTLEQSNSEQIQQDTIQKDKVMLQPTAQSTTKLDATKLANYAQPSLGRWFEKKSGAPADVKEMAPPATNAEESNFPETLPLMEIHSRWTCALCSVTATSERIFNDHIQGKKHKSKCKQLETTQEDKVILQPTEQSATRPTVTNLAHHAQPNLDLWVKKKSDPRADLKEMEPPNSEKKSDAPADVKEMEPPNSEKKSDAPAAAKEMEPPNSEKKSDAPADAKEMEPPNSEKKPDAPADVKEMAPPDANAEESNFPEALPLMDVHSQWTCALCSVTTTSERTLNDHIQGKKHKSKCKQLETTQEDKAMLQPTEQSATRNMINLANHAQLNIGPWVEKKSDPRTDVEEIEPPYSKEAESIHPETPLKKIQREWTCALCLVRTTSQNDLNAHLQGNRHKYNSEQLKTGKNSTNDTRSLALMKDKANKVELEAAQKPAADKWLPKLGIPKQEGAASQSFMRICKVCQVKSPSNVDWQSHINGRRHLSNTMSSYILNG